MGEKFAANPVTGTGSLTVPIAASPGRSGFGPQLSLAYDSGFGNGPFGLGWKLSTPSITRKTDKGLPQYRDAEESDVYILSDVEDLVPVLQPEGTRFESHSPDQIYVIRRYRPRIEGLFARIERWTNSATGEVHWRSISKDNVTTVYGKDNNSRIYDPADSSPEHPLRVFSWLVCESYDDKGNAMVYEYVAEDGINVDSAQANERNRVPTANRYLKRVKYGNPTPNRDANTWEATAPAGLPNDTWMFELVFDYGDGHYAEESAEIQSPIFARARVDAPAGFPSPVRQDPFSTCRSGFEVRTYRLCRRVLMFHHFPEELGIADCLVSSTDFSYSENAIASFTTAVRQSGYVRQPQANQPDRYLKKSLPPLEFKYSQALSPDQLARQPIQELDPESLTNLPVGVNGSSYQWIDLDGEGSSGILAEQAGGWFYKRNLGANNEMPEDSGARVDGRFGPAEKVSPKPAAALAAGARFLALAGNGQVDLVQMEGPARGFYRRTDVASWEPFQPFASSPDLNPNDLNLRFIDLTGDGRSDMLMTEGEALVWFPSLGEEGFGPAVRINLPLDEEKGPRLVFSDGTQSIFLADSSGDGLSDLIRIRNGEICYWPNLGYGRFGAKVTMDNAPRFESQDRFDPRRIRLADIDGSGTTDIIYLAQDGVRLFFNQSGNRWSEACVLEHFPQTDNLSTVTVTDLLGRGTACLVWSSPLSGQGRSSMRYIDLMPEKPHLLVKMANNLGAETVIRYAPSTKFYLQDKQNGRAWITRLPFPVHCVERVETYDRVSGNRFVSRYKYHHGNFDGIEREFRGFGMVEQWDTEEIGSVASGESSSAATNLDAASLVPPIHTKTWFHTGVYIGRDRVSNYFAGPAGEYYREPGWSIADAKASLLQDTILPAGLTPDEEREACRALKGAMLRQEIYGLDATPRAEHPYIVTEQNVTIECLQPQGSNRHAVFFTHARESLTFQYERNPDDPRIAHTITLETDKYGNALKSVAIGYGRRRPVLVDQADREKQRQTLITYTENTVTNGVDDAGQPNDYRAPLASETRMYELTGYTMASGAVRFEISDFVRTDPVDASGRKRLLIFDSELKYEEQATVGRQRRLFKRGRTLYRRNDLTSLSPLGHLESLALAGESYQLAFTRGFLAQVYARQSGASAAENLLPDPASVLGGRGGDQGGYVDLDADGSWWIPSGRLAYSTAADSSRPADTAAVELAEARRHFFLTRKFTDPFNHDSSVEYDAFDLLLVQTRDAVGNTVTARCDYRVLKPIQVTDANGNRSEVRFDALGMVAGTSVMGKAVGPVAGDSFDAFAADLTPQQVMDYFDAANPRSLAITHLGTATTRLIYDLDRVPACSSVIARETHVTELSPGQQANVQISFVYSDGFGRKAQTRIQAEPGPLEPDAAGSPMLNPRWVASGTKIYDNKGNPVRQYEPFFSAAHQFGLEQHGVSSTLFYDPASRVVATLHPNRTWEKVVFDPWQQGSFDVNDTLLNADGSTDPKSDNDVKGFFSRLPEADYLPTWYERRIALPANDPERAAAEKAAVHRQTPTVSHLDVLGRVFLSIAHNRFVRNGSTSEESYPSRTEFDIQGNPRVARDAVVQGGDPSGRIVMRYDYDMGGNRIHHASMEAGERWMLNDVTGKAIRAWDSRGHQFRTEYDELRRPLHKFVRGADAAHSDPRTLQKDVLFENTEYGEGQPNDMALNLRTRVFRQRDTAGIATFISRNQATGLDEAYDFKGNLLRSSRQLAQDYKALLDWSAAVPLQADVFVSSTTYDALNRPLTLTTPDTSVVRLTYNEANLLETIATNLRGDGAPTAFVTDIDYNAKAQRTRIVYGNGVTSTYRYDPLTFRLTRLQTLRGVEPVQDMSYTYDPTGNITHIRDDAQQAVYFRNRRVDPSNDYTYDAIYRLIEAVGREHLGQNGAGRSAAPVPTSYNDWPRAGLLQPGDGNAMGTYRQQYAYDEAGNFREVVHRGTDPASAGWTRAYSYLEASLLEPGKQNNRLSWTTVSPGAVQPQDEIYDDDPHGNMIRMPHLQVMQWDLKDQLLMTRRQAVNAADDDGTLHQGERTYYIYDASGKRVRKVTELGSGQVKAERVYLGSFEIYRRQGTNAVVRETLHLVDDKQRIALVETRTQGNDGSPPQLIRYQFGNHLGSACLELDHQAQIISYEEYYPYGSTSYQAVRGQSEAPKRYRFSGKERDEENGFYYHGVRYYAAWIARWISCDPLGTVDGPNLYRYACNSPTRLLDENGTAPGDWEDIDLKDVGDELRNDANVADKLRDTRPPIPSVKGVDYQKARNTGAKQAANASGASSQGGVLQENHTRAVRYAKKAGLPAGELNKSGSFQTLHSRRDPVVKADVFSINDPTSVERTNTHHRLAESLIDAENQKVPPNDPTGVADSADAVKNQFPATADYGERARVNWERLPSGTGKGASVDPVTGRVITTAEPPVTTSAEPSELPVITTEAPPLEVPINVPRLVKWGAALGKAAGAVEAALQFVGRAVTLLGAANEANESFNAAHGSFLDKVGLGAGTFLLGVAGGLFDDAFVVGTGGAGIGLVADSYKDYGSGSAQHLLGELNRAADQWWYDVFIK